MEALLDSVTSPFMYLFKHFRQANFFLFTCQDRSDILSCQNQSKYSVCWIKLMQNPMWFAINLELKSVLMVQLLALQCGTCSQSSILCTERYVQHQILLGVGPVLQLLCEAHWVAEDQSFLRGLHSHQDSFSTFCWSPGSDKTFQAKTMIMHYHKHAQYNILISNIYFFRVEMNK